MAGGIELAAVLPDNLPRIRGDGRELQQMILNLISNSAAAMNGACGMGRDAS
jgi:signal transduction histidine kinase